MPSIFMAKFQSSMIYLNVAAVCIVVIALPVGLRANGLALNSGEVVFGSMEPATTNYPKGFAFILGWNCAIYCSSILDAPTHMAEETKDAERAIPFAVLLSCGFCFIFGSIIMCVLAAVIDWDNVDALFLAELPMAATIQRCLGTTWSLALMSIFTFIQFIQALSSMYANSRQCFALARDNALPFSSTLRLVDNRGSPYAAVLCTFTVAFLLGLLILAGNTAAEALFSMCVTSIYMAWAIPIWLYAYDCSPVTPGPFYVNKLVSRISCYIAPGFYFLVIIVITLFPSNVPVTSPALMNWSVVVCCGTWLVAIIWYHAYAKRVYAGPVTTIRSIEAEVIEAVMSQAHRGEAEKTPK
jgi:amino acid transporter